MCFGQLRPELHPDQGTAHHSEHNFPSKNQAGGRIMIRESYRIKEARYRPNLKENLLEAAKYLRLVNLQTDLTV